MDSSGQSLETTDSRQWVSHKSYPLGKPLSEQLVFVNGQSFSITDPVVARAQPGHIVLRVPMWSNWVGIENKIWIGLIYENKYRTMIFLENCLTYYHWKDWLGVCVMQILIISVIVIEF